MTGGVPHEANSHQASPHQASAVAIGGRGLLIEGPPGSGKSSLALALIDRGAVLIGDDGLLLEARGAQLWALPHPGTAGLLEIRNVGIVTHPVTAAPLALAITLDRTAPRHVTEAVQIRRAGYALPAIALWPDSPVLSLRAETALALYGLPA